MVSTCVLALPLLSSKLPREYYRKIYEDKKIKKRHYNNIRNKNMSDTYKEIKKEYAKNSYYKWKNFESFN